MIDIPINKYGILKGKVIGAKREEDYNTPHFQVHILAGDIHYRIAVNVMSQINPPNLLFFAAEDFQHPIIATLPTLAVGFTNLQSKSGGQALDYIRSNLFKKEDMRILPPSIPGADNDLSDKLEYFVSRAIKEEDAQVYAFGEPWGPETSITDKIFGFKPGNGIHNIHMNQGNDPQHQGEDGIWQDGALFFHFPSSNQWVAIFLAFQSQTWHTDDITGHAIPDQKSDGIIRIIAAEVNPIGMKPERKTVTLINTSPDSINLEGWQIADQLKNKHTLSGTIDGGTVILVTLPPQLKLSNKGGIITLLNDNGIKIDGVSYTKKQASKKGWTIVF